jgi:hypothetical protein
MGSFLDQIEWFQAGSGKRRINLELAHGRNFDFTQHVCTE